MPVGALCGYELIATMQADVLEAETAIIAVSNHNRLGMY
jgi:hypothetical protein